MDFGVKKRIKSNPAVKKYLYGRDLFLHYRNVDSNISLKKFVLGNIRNIKVIPCLGDKIEQFLELSKTVDVVPADNHSKTLIEAQMNPDLFPNLVVRVWGFSAYFKDLPKDYQDNLIRRTKEAEKNM